MSFVISYVIFYIPFYDVTKYLDIAILKLIIILFRHMFYPYMLYHQLIYQNTLSLGIALTLDIKLSCFLE